MDNGQDATSLVEAVDVVGVDRPEPQDAEARRIEVLRAKLDAVTPDSKLPQVHSAQP